MEQFAEHYRALNARQKEAVDTIEGPVMVIAGPGTGKTQLLSMRVANILRKTDVNPSNILCLTFTESGAAAMRERLVSLVGQPAYGVAIHTFHSFGTEIINGYSDYFYRGAHFRAADELSSYEVLREIFDKLTHENPLASNMNGEYTALRDVQKAISDLKKSGLTPDELQQILDHNESFIAFAEPFLRELFGERLSKKSFQIVGDTINNLRKYQEQPVPVIGYAPLSDVVIGSLETALARSEESDNTKALGSWRGSWLEKNEDGRYVFKDHKRNKKLRALSAVYYEYLIAMQERALYDFDDMILRVVHGLEVFADLRYNLQEQYQYILVDEFQDTNGAQVRMLYNLTNNEASEGRPNILIVGDDDQAIYRFQGAEISNIIDFEKLYRDVRRITLTDNYRSTEPILRAARSIVVQGEERLENKFPDVDKSLFAHKTDAETAVELHTMLTQGDEFLWITDQVKQQIAKGVTLGEIAIIGRNHAELRKLLPYLHRAEIPVTYERQDNVLEIAPVILVEQVSRILVMLGDQQFREVDALMPELLAHPAWGISTIELWQLSLKAFKDHRLWLEIMLESPGKLKDLAEWLIVTAHLAQHEPLEIILDRILGTDEFQVAHDDIDETYEPFQSGPPEEFVSPIRAYFFSSDSLHSSASEYMTYLSALTTIRRRLREYRPDDSLQLQDFVEFVELHRKTGLIISNSEQFQCEEECVHVMTAHKSKGLEFDVVYVVSVNDHIWGSKSRGRSSSISFPHNIPLAPVGDSDDERIRLLFVAMTRARKQLFISTHQLNFSGKAVLPAPYISIPELPATIHEQQQDGDTLILAAESAWHENVLKLPQSKIEALLKPTLERYKLSATHLNNFIDVTAGGPQSFLLQNLLRFPQAMSPSAAFGSAVHGALQRAHAHLSATGKRRPVEDVLHDFDELLSRHQLSRSDMEYLQQRGSDVLHKFLSQRYDSFSDSQIVERNFSSQGVCIDGVNLTGAIDLLEVDKESRSVIVTDYKTGKAARSWKGAADYEKIKLHKYKQQLMLYKLLVENCRDFDAQYTVPVGILEFVEPTPAKNEIIRLELHYDSDELERFKLLLKAVWHHIQTLDFPDISDYEQSYKGLLQFEQDLIDQAEQQKTDTVG